MMKRYARAKAAATMGGGGGGGGGGDASAGDALTFSAGPAFGPRYEAHVAELQRQLDDARAAAAAADAAGAGAQAAAADAADAVAALALRRHSRDDVTALVAVLRA